VLIPFKVNGIQQVFHVDPSIVTAPAATSGPRTGLGATQIYNFTLTTQDVGLPEKVTFGIGPLVAVPTATSTNFGPDSLQGGGAGVIIAPQSWGLLGVLVTYQHTLWGPSSRSERERRPCVPGELLVRFERLLTSSDHSVSPSTWFAR
jgi:hypothetical protein